MTSFSGSPQHRWLVHIARALLVGAILLGAFYLVEYIRLPKPSSLPEPPDASGTLAFPEFAEIDDALWQVYQSSAGDIPANTSPLAQRLRLAGTFFSYSDQDQAGVGGTRKAIIDDLQKRTQLLVQENDQIDDVKIVNIYKDRVIVRHRGRDETLWLSFSGGGVDSSASSSRDIASDEIDISDEDVIGTTRYGKQVGLNRWVLSRDSVMEYYQELLDDPERLAAIYLSLKPDYKPDETIGGYFLDVEGEGDFFSDMGLVPGDTIRKVNSVPMTSQTRAEVFLSEFVNDRLSAVVIDIERDGEDSKLVYLIR